MKELELGINSTNTIQQQKSQPLESRPEEEQTADAEAPGLVQRREPIIEQRWFVGSICGIVIINCATIGLETDYGSGDGMYAILNNIFLVVYMGELSLRLFTFGTLALRDKMALFDMFIVLTAFFEQMVGNSNLAKSLPALRLVRLTRIFRATKLLRISPEFVVLNLGFAGAMTTLWWMVCVLTLMLWCVAAPVYTAIGRSDKFETAIDPNDTSGDELTQFNNYEYFGSMLRSFYSLFQLVTLSQWSDQMARPILKVYPLTALFFLTWTMVTSYGLMMVVTANVVQDSLRTSRANKIAMEQKDKELREKHGKECRALFMAGDKDGNGELDTEELAEALEDPEICELLQALRVPSRFFDAESLISMLDFEGNGTVSYDELLEGVVKLDNEIVPKDFTHLSLRLNNLLKRATFLDQRLQELSQKVRLLRGKLEGALEAVKRFERNAHTTIVFSKAKQELRAASPYEDPLPIYEKRKLRTGPIIPVKSEGEEFMAVIKRLFGGGGPSPESLAKIAKKSASLPALQPSAGDELAKVKGSAAAKKVFATLHAASKTAVRIGAAEGEVREANHPAPTEAWVEEAPKLASDSNQKLRQAAHQPDILSHIHQTVAHSFPPQPKDKYAMKGISVNPKLREMQLEIAEPQLQRPTNPKPKKQGKRDVSSLLKQS